MPISVEWNFRHNELINRLRDYCRKTRFSKIKTDISFIVEGEGEGKEEEAVTK
jgi:hypothetical protein